MNTSPRILVSIVALATASMLPAEEPRGGRPEAEQLLEKASQAKSEGRYDEAKELYDKAQKLRNEAHERDGKKLGTDVPKDDRFANAKREIQELEHAGKHEEAEHRMRELREAWGREHGKEVAPSEGKGAGQLQHLTEAIRHLRAAGLNEVAEHLEQQARRMHEEYEQRTREHMENSGEGKAGGDQLSLVAGELRKLREQVGKLSREMDKLHEEVSHTRGDGRKSD